MKIPKNHKSEARDLWLSDLEGPVEQVISYIREKSEGMIDPEIQITQHYDYVDFAVVGIRPMTEKELEAAKKQRKREREANKARKEAEQLRQEELLQELADKLGYKVEKGS